jgi:hypothetical protein
LQTLHDIAGRFFRPGRDRAFADVLGIVADPLKCAGDPQRAHDLTQIDRHGLAARNGENGLLLDLMLHDIDSLVRGDRRLRRSLIATEQSAHGVADLLFDDGPHVRDFSRQLLELGVEGLDRVIGHGDRSFRILRGRG